uniref:Secreted protein n=1 Tax=Rhipicephalus appendiculatus TaxID=34631 RepID=A0A131YER1_RHIAP
MLQVCFNILLISLMSLWSIEFFQSSTKPSCLRILGTVGKIRQKLAPTMIASCKGNSNGFVGKKRGFAVEKTSLSFLFFFCPSFCRFV